MVCITQATQERAALPEGKRRPTFVYIDEAQDYFDEGIEGLLNQARKYRVGLVLAHQNLGQLEARLQAAVMASTAIKLVGGVSARDASVMAREMGCEPEFLQGMRKGARHTEFACFVRNQTPRPIRLAVPFGQMEGQERMDWGEQHKLLRVVRFRYCGELNQEAAHAQSGKDGFSVEEDDLL